MRLFHYYINGSIHTFESGFVAAATPRKAAEFLATDFYERTPHIKELEDQKIAEWNAGKRPDRVTAMRTDPYRAMLTMYEINGASGGDHFEFHREGVRRYESTPTSFSETPLRHILDIQKDLEEQAEVKGKRRRRRVRPWSAKALAERTKDAFSFSRYTNWLEVAHLLLALGYNQKEAEAIMRSKYMRWAADRVAPDNVPAGAIEAYLNDLSQFGGSIERREKAITELVANTVFPEDIVEDEEAPEE